MLTLSVRQSVAEGDTHYYVFIEALYKKLTYLGKKKASCARAALLARNSALSCQVVGVVLKWC
jgi:hypothetical protein